ARRAPCPSRRRDHRAALCGRVPQGFDPVCHRRGRRGTVKITSVEVLVLKSPGLYHSTEDAAEPPGPTYMGVVRVSTDAGITGYSDMETAASVAKAAVEAPRWSDDGLEAFDGLAA